jgi:hypothetical protein
MYPARLSLETKCPNCNSSITSIGGTLYACHKGHVIECVVLVTLNRTVQEQTVVTNLDQKTDGKPKIEAKSKLSIGPVTNTDRLVS